MMANIIVVSMVENIGLSIIQQIHTILLPLLKPLTELLMGIFDTTAQTYPVDILRVLVSIPVLTYAMVSDFNTRRVSNEAWIPLFVFGFLFIILDLVTGKTQILLPWIISNIAAGTTLGYILYKTRLFGGADFKAIAGFSVLFPTYPLLITFPLSLPPIAPPPYNVINLFSLTIMSNTVLIAALYPLYLFVHNMMQNNSKSILIQLTARKDTLACVVEKHGKILPLWTLDSDNDSTLRNIVNYFKFIQSGIDIKLISEYIEWYNQQYKTNINSFDEVETVTLSEFLESDYNKDSNGDTRWVLSDNGDTAEQALERLTNKSSVWYTPGIPFLIPLGLGLVTALTFGDLFFAIVW
ncbi:A24 family peptidase [Haloquadratum walsbyi]|uniref:Flp pilus assembly protein, protease CpaA n=1 Tax=Haloquadratum walsbyi J07HQW2 TaxID=1238425 RepID=U1NB12_9EURY|nr:A24 family peptidase [Haloquadratum walsbyi]ERG94045.1 MAG: Flp pilus assembly protein, protease CpaA [Haloquadratum walsbyi J07HQW2]